MNILLKSWFATASLVAVSTTKLYAQFMPSGYEIGISGGTLIYQGDLTPDLIGYTKHIKPMIAVHVAKELNPSFALRVNLAFGGILADETQYSMPEWRQDRNFKFNSSINELSAMLVWNLYGKSADYNYRRFSPYLFAGVGGTLVNINRDWSQLNTTVFDPKSKVGEGLGIDTLNTLPKVIAVLPVGAGVKYFLSPRVYVNAELNYRFTPSDYLDGFKYSANENKRDRYYGLSVGIFYRFGKDRSDCPSAR